MIQRLATIVKVPIIVKTLLIALWLAIGAAVLGGLYWGFLNTPESNVFTLVLSALLVLLMIAIAAIVVNVAVLVALESPFRSSLVTGARRIAWFVIALVPVALITWAILRGDGWIAQKSGEISAWFIARFGWADVSALFAAQSYLSIWLRWVLLPVTAIALLAAFLQHGGRGAASSRWIRSAWHWRTLLIATLAFVVLIALPGRAAYWSQENLPPTWVQPTVAALRLSLVGVAFALGAAVMIFATARQSIKATANAEK
jgi:hypothetical protein